MKRPVAGLEGRSTRTADQQRWEPRWLRGSHRRKQQLKRFRGVSNASRLVVRSGSALSGVSQRQAPRSTVEAVDEGGMAGERRGGSQRWWRWRRDPSIWSSGLSRQLLQEEMLSLRPPRRSVEHSPRPGQMFLPISVRVDEARWIRLILQVLFPSRRITNANP